MSPQLIANYELATENEGFQDWSALLAGMPILRVEVDITTLPNDQDIYFGDPETLHAGWFGFGYLPRAEQSQITGGVTLSAGIFSPYLSRLQYINYARAVFFPQSPEETGFFVKLKTGVKASVKVYATNARTSMDSCPSSPPENAREISCHAHPDQWEDIPHLIGSACPSYPAITAQFNYAGNPLMGPIDGPPSGFHPAIFQPDVLVTNLDAFSPGTPFGNNSGALSGFENDNPLSVIGFSISGRVPYPCVGAE
jgi:hypothetical protein